MMGPFILLIGLGLLYTAYKGRSGEVLVGLIDPHLAQRINDAEQALGGDIGAWFRFHVWDQLTNAVISGLPTLDITLPGGIHIGTTPPQKQPTNANDAAQGRHP